MESERNRMGTRGPGNLSHARSIEDEEKRRVPLSGEDNGKQQAFTFIAGFRSREIAVALSVVALGLAVALRRGIPMPAAMALAGLFAIFHGHAHGAEMPDVSGYAYAAGFMLATALLHGAGVAAGVLMGRIGEPGSRLAQAAGGAMAMVGAASLTGAG